jgi:CDP-diacylglycerol--glycerol-3-phosphate 3-phosphatidyltransferase
MKVINVPLNIPNILSLYRLYSFPFILIFVILGHEYLFAFFICFNLITDILDGWIARRFHQITEIGEKIDGLADNGTYILAITGVFVFKWSDFHPHAVSFFIFLGLFILSRLYFLMKFGKFHGFHAYSGKIGGYIHGSFFIVLFVFGFYDWFYYIMIISGYIISVENLLIIYFLKECRSNVKGLYWLLREKRTD